MGLSDKKISVVLGVKDIGEAKEFYEGKLGLSGGTAVGDGGITYSCGGDTELHIYPSPNAGKAETTAAAWGVDDVEATVGELTGNGVSFEQYEQEGLKTDEKGVATVGDDKVAFFKDPTGNIIALGQST